MTVRAKTWLKRIGLALAGVVAILAALAAWLLATETGARFAVERAKSALAGKLAVAQANGTLTSPLELRDVVYADPASGLTVRVNVLRLDYEFQGLFHKTLHVRSLDLDGVDVALTTVPSAPPAAAPSLQSLLTPPLAILIDRLHLGATKIAQDGKPVFASDSLDAAATWTTSALTLERLALRAPAGKVDFTGAITQYKNLIGQGKLDIDWQLPATAADGTPPPRATATIDLDNDGQHMHFALAASQPFLAHAKGTLATAESSLPWTLDLDVPNFDPKPLTQSAALKSLALKFTGSGDKKSGVLNASVDLDDHRVLLDPLKFAIDGATLTLDPLRLHSPEARGALTARAEVHWEAKPVGGKIGLEWNDVVLPADLVGQTLATHGSLAVNGNADKFAAQGTLSIGPPQRIADIAFELDGTPDRISLARLELKQPKGGLDASGEIVLKPSLAWDIEAKANQFDPGAFAQDWPGTIDFRLTTKGRVEKDGPTGQLALTHLAGTLRQRPLAGDGDIAFSPPLNVDGKLDVSSGRSTVAIVGKGGAGKGLQTDLKIDLGIADLGDWLPKSSGSLRGDIAIHGAYPKLDANGRIEGAGLVGGDAHLQSFTLDVDAKNLSAPNGRIALDAKTLSIAGHTFDTIELDAHGSQAAHHLTLGLRGKPLSLALALDGGSTPSRTSHDWRGTLQELTLAPPGLPEWKLAQPTAMSYVGGAFELAPACLRADAASLCAQARRDANAGSVAKFSLEHLPLAMLARFLNPEATAKPDGEINGNGALDAAADGALSGNLAANIDSLAFVDLLTQQLSGTRGRIEAKFALSGTTAQPGIDGEFSLADFATEIPAAGIALRDGHLRATSRDGAHFDIDGGIASNEGKLAIDGRLGIAANAPLALTIRGEDFLVANIPGARIHVSPDLKIDRDDKRLRVGGSVGIPRMFVDLSKLPGGGALAPSPDVVVTDDKAADSGAVANAPVEVEVAVKLGAGEKLAMDLRQGTEVRLIGFGLNANLGGQLTVAQQPGKTPTGRGQIEVNGTFKAYGQDLTIEQGQGRLLFAGTPVENPGLDIRAIRAFPDENVTVGLQVRGTALAPTLTVFSTPAMEQSDALSYLVAGKPLSQLKGGDGNAVSSAAAALGTAGGDLLAKSIGTKMGLDDVGVADNSAVGGAALTVGKYLSPRLYMSYGVGLFTPGQVVTLRYKLTRLFDFEMQNGTLSSRASIDYRVEK